MTVPVLGIEPRRSRFSRRRDITTWNLSSFKSYWAFNVHVHEHAVFVQKYHEFAVFTLTIT